MSTLQSPVFAVGFRARFWFRLIAGSILFCTRSLRSTCTLASYLDVTFSAGTSLVLSNLTPLKVENLLICPAGHRQGKNICIAVSPF